MKSWLQKSKEIEEELIANRRYLHKNAETGFDLEKTSSFVIERLTEMGYTPERCGKNGVIATLGQGKPIFLLRADMDGLPIAEKSGESFSCKAGKMHACGHDMHTAMLLGGARLLKMREGELKGRIKLLFQPAEEILEGAKSMIESGALAPKPNGAMMLHAMTAVDLPVGYAVVAADVSAPAADYFTVTVRGKGCHGSTPWKGVDALSVAAHILLALQEIPARELTVAQPAVLTVGCLQTSEGGNVISDRAFLQGTLRSFDEGVRAQVKRRIEEISGGVAKAFRARAKVEYGGGCPTLVNDGELASFALAQARELLGAEGAMLSSELTGDVKNTSGGSEDFAYISHEVPSVMIALGAGEKKKGFLYPLHHPKARFDEASLAIGAALYAKISFEWLAARK